MYNPYHRRIKACVGIGCPIRSVCQLYSNMKISYRQEVYRADYNKFTLPVKDATKHLSMYEMKSEEGIDTSSELALFHKACSNLSI